MSKKTRIYCSWMSTGQREDLHLYMLDEWRKRYAEHVELVLPDMALHQMFHDAARNSHVEEFLNSDCDMMWFLDSDVVPPPHVLDLVAFHKDKWQVAGAPYPLWITTPGKTDMAILFTAYNGVDDKSETGAPRGIYMSEVPEEGTAFVDGLATGCLFIKREVFSKLKRPWFEFKFDPTTKRIQEGEDLGFCLKMHDLGIKFFTDYSMVCKHYKRIDLLDLNNYAMRMRNHAIESYCAEVKPQIEAAYKAAYEAGRKKGRQEASIAEAPVGPPRTKSGLILPEGLQRV